MSLMSTDRVAALIRTVQTVTDTYSQDRNVRAADMAALAAALAEVVTPASAVADLTVYATALADADINPLYQQINAIRYLRNAHLVESLVAAKNIVFELNVRTVVAYIDETGQTHPADIGDALSIHRTQAFIAEARTRALITRTVGQ